MIGSYITVAVRSLLRQPGYTVINIVGLAVGIASCLYILIYIHSEFSVDRHHSRGERAYQVLRELREPGGDSRISAGTSGPLGPALEAEVPEVEGAARIWRRNGTWVQSGDDGQYLTAAMSEPGLFELFDVRFLEGSPGTVFRDPFSVVLTESTAQRFFGSRSPVGERLLLDHWYFQKREFTVTGVIEDQRYESVIGRFDFVTATILPGEPLNWWLSWHGTYSIRPIATFVLLREGVDPGTLDDKLADLMARHMGEEIRKQNTYYLQPLRRIHLFSRQDYGMGSLGDIDRIQLCATIALLIAGIACVNFTNLATARSALRSREVGLRKVMGANRSTLILRFLSESIILSLGAAVLGVVLAALGTSYLNELLDIRISFADVVELEIAIGLVGVTLLVGLAAGSYPAFVIASYEPADVMRSRSASGGVGVGIRRVLVLVQFVASIVLLISTVVMHRQAGHLLSQDPGFESENRLLLPLFDTDRVSKNRYQGEATLAPRYWDVKHAFLEHPNVLSVTAFRYPPGYGYYNIRNVRTETRDGIDWRVLMNEVDEDFVSFYDLEIVEGRDFTDTPADRVGAYLLNETAVEQLGWREAGQASPIGRPFDWGRRKGEVVGVVKDFATGSLRDPILPLAFSMRPDIYSRLGVKIAGEDVRETMAFLEKTWKSFLPNRPFQFTFENVRLEEVYESDRRFAELGTLFAGLAILVGCLGLLGLAAAAADQRSREVGIRKVLGSKTSEVVLLLSSDFVRLVGYANLVAWPIGFWLMRSWLSSFASQVGVEWWVFPVSGVAVLVVAFGTVSAQVWQAAVADPVESLRSE